MNIKKRILNGLSKSLVIINLFSGIGLNRSFCDDINLGYKPSIISVSKKLNKRKKDSRYLHRKTYKGMKIWDFESVKFCLPNYPQDLIQNHIISQNDYFEGNLLRKLDKFIPKGAIILDIGANIGNHTVYWAMQDKIKKVYSFEPLKETFNMLEKNIEINDLEEKVKLFNIGLSYEESSARISHFDKTNIGGTSIEKTADGSLVVNKLDNIKINEDRIDFIKIDVEGHEIKVLNGAKETFLKYKPKYVFIESFSNNFPKVKEILESYGYKLTDFPVEYSNYLFEYKEKD